MISRTFGAALVAGFAVLGTAAGRSLSGQVITRVSPAEVSVAAGDTIDVQFTGTNLTAVQGFELRLGSSSARGVQVTLQRSATRIRARFQIAATVRPTAYSLYVVSARGMSRVPVEFRIVSPRPAPRVTGSISPLTPSRTRAALASMMRALSQQNVSTVLPRVTSYSPTDGYIGLDLTIQGTNFIPNAVRVSLGSNQLQIVSSGGSEVVARLPSTRTLAPLTISHGTDVSLITLDPDYKVAGNPVITGVNPTSFFKGDIVTITGVDLTGAWIPQRCSDCASHYIKIGPTASSTGQYFVHVADWDVADDGSSATFQALDVYQIPASGGTYGLNIVDPQPTTVQGPIRLITMGQTQWDVVGPSVAWNKPSLRVDALSPPAWASSIPNFIIAKADKYQNPVSVTGSNLGQASATIGGVDLLESISTSGVSGLLFVPINAPSGLVTFEKDGVTASSPNQLIVIPEPDFLEADFSGDPWSLTVGATIRLRGWNLMPPASVGGLIYRFELSGLPSVGCGVSLNVLNHTADYIDLQVVSSGAIPVTCDQTTLFGGTSTAFNVARLIARYNNQDRELWRRAYFLVR